MTRSDRAQRFGAVCEALVANDDLMAAFVALADEEIALRRQEAAIHVLANNPHEALKSAASAEGIFDFLAILKGVANDYRALRTSAA